MALPPTAAPLPGHGEPVSLPEGAGQVRARGSGQQLYYPEYIEPAVLRLLLLHPKVILTRNLGVMLAVSQLLFAVGSMAMFFVRRSVTVIVFNVIFILQDFLAIYAFLTFRPAYALAFVGIQGGFLAATICYAGLMALTKGEFMIFAVHIPMLVDVAIWMALTASSFAAYDWWSKVFLPQSEALRQQAAEARAADAEARQAVAVGRALDAAESRASGAGHPAATPSPDYGCEVTEDERLRCPICLTFQSNGCLIPCGHMFCWKCIKEHLSRPRSTCPLCRKVVQSTVRTFY